MHVRCCKAGGGHEYERHQMVVSVLQRMLEAAGKRVWVDAVWGERCAADKVCIADLGPEGGSQRVDPSTGKGKHLWLDLMVEGDDGKKDAVDVMVTCAHRQVSGRRSAVQAGEAAKYTKNGASCAGHESLGVADPIHFRPFVLDDLGALGTDARALVVWATASAKAHCGHLPADRHQGRGPAAHLHEVRAARRRIGSAQLWHAARGARRGGARRHHLLLHLVPVH